MVSEAALFNPPGVSDDAGLVQAVLSGHLQAFETLVDKYLTRVVKFVQFYGSRSGEAEDVAQETFIKAYRNLQRYDPAKSFLTWLLVIAKHTLIDFKRKEKRNLRQLPPPEQNPDDNPENRTVRREPMQGFLAGLTAADRLLVELRVFDDVDFSEIAEMLGEGESTLRSRLHRILKKWKEALQEGKQHEKR